MMAAVNGTTLEQFEEAPPRVSDLRRFLRVFLGRKIVVFGMIVIGMLLLTALFAPWLAPYDPNEPSLTNTLAPPSSAHLLGTDSLGRDTLSRIIYGSRLALAVGFIAVSIAALIGMTLGLLAGFYGKFVNAIIMRSMDAIMSVPMILLAVTISALLGGGLKNVLIALGIALIPPYARQMCSQVLTVKQNDYITAARAGGASDLRIMLAHMLPNCFPPLIVLMTMQIGTAILSEASLSFLGIGIKPPDAAWGSMVSEGYQNMLRAPVLSIAPGIAIMLVVFAFNMVGDGLRDALDPKLRGTL
ncbi:MAG: ABC transporter permease [Deltaproteobacteria bacterium]|nr:ABC transporter permease [Deltaproteobacteria bacterium]